MVACLPPLWCCSISLASGVVAGVASAIISHPADTLLSKVRIAPAARGIEEEGGEREAATVRSRLPSTEPASRLDD